VKKINKTSSRPWRIVIGSSMAKPQTSSSKDPKPEQADLPQINHSNNQQISEVKKANKGKGPSFCKP
jgi:hypothetical protein